MCHLFAADLLIWVVRCGLVAVGWLLWVSRCGFVAGGCGVLARRLYFPHLYAIVAR